MNDENDRVSRVANDGPLTILMVVGALGAVFILVMLVSQGRVSSQELERVGPIAVALAVSAALLALAFFARVIVAIRPRRAGNARDRAIRHDVASPSKRES